jgi:integral membrane sensor domain MASE1/GAF domain-containing protein
VTLASTSRDALGSRVDSLRASTAGAAVVYLVSLGLLVGAYYGAGRIGLELAYLDGAVSSFWPPAGVGVAALFLFGVRLWPAIVVADLLLGDFSQPLWVVLAQTVGNTLAVVVAALVLQRLTWGRGGLERVTHVLAFVACAALAAGISAAIGPTALRASGVVEANRIWRTWFLSDASGILVVAPFLLAWASGHLRRFTRWEAVEGLAILALLVFLAEVPSQRDVPYVVFPVLIWAALRFGPRGAATTVLLVTALTVWNTANEEGPFVRDSLTQQLLTTQLFIALAALTSLILAAVTAERRRASEEAEALATEQTALRRVATLVASEGEPASIFEQVTEEVGRLLGAPSVTVTRYEEDGLVATVVGAWSEPGVPRFPLGETIPLDGDTVVARVYRTSEPERVEDYDATTGTLAETLRGFGYRSSVAAPVKLGTRLWGTLVAATVEPRPLPDGTERRLCDFAELVGQALANVDAHEKLAASRARLVEAGDAERRRLERNLHDGAQQRLVSLALQLKLVGAKIDTDPERARTLLAAGHEELDRALDELRELARGIHPAVLTDRGLAPALEALLARSPVPVRIEAIPEERLSEPARRPPTTSSRRRSRTSPSTRRPRRLR